MKKITFLIVLLAFGFSWYGTAQITSYPYAEDFEAGAGGWVATNGANGTWALGAPAATIINSAASGANAWVTNLAGLYNAGENSSVQSPVFDLSTLSAPSIQVSIWWNAEFSWDGMVLQSSLDAGASWQNVGALGDPNNWYTDNSISGNPGGQQVGWSGRNSSGNGSGGWVVARHALTGLAGQSNVILRFAFGSDGSVQDEGVAFDSVSIFEVTCPEPSGLMVDSQTATTANISWTPGGSETAWEVAVQDAGTGVPTGAGDPTNLNSPYVAMGLTPASAYEVYVRSACGGEFSPWIGPINFLTECTSFVAPYSEGFENGGAIPICWTMSGGENWLFSNTGAGNHIGNNGTITGTTATNGYFAWVDSSGSEGPATLLSPLVDVSGLTTPALSFYEISNNEGNANSTLTVDVWDGAAWNNVGIFNTNTSGWEQIIIDLSVLNITGDIQARFVFSETTSGDFYDDIAIDDVRFDEAPLCINPSGLTVSNVTGTSADISWNGGASTAWEYVIQPPGTGVPSGNGTPLTVTTVNETNLSFSTTYEVYIRTDCGANGYSDWIGPVTFTTTVQTDFIVDCNVGPVSSVTCYDSNNGIGDIITFTSSDGVSQLNITFNSGNVENNWDELIVLDSNGTTNLNAATPYGAAGNVAGITYQSSGPSISFYVEADSSISCQSSATINPLDVTVSCATCINPTATYTVIDDCDNGDQFLIDVNITSLGDANSLTITDNQGSAPVQVFATGVVQTGPYGFANPVVITISNDQDVNCIINSTPIQLLACPPANDNCIGATVASVNADESCNLVTSGTILQATPSGVPNGSCTGNPNDDVWFQFTALGTQQIITLQNFSGGTTNIDHAVYSGTCDNLVQMYCSDDTFSVTPQLVIGNTYFVRVFTGGAAADSTTFDLCINTLGNPTYCLEALPICAGISYPSNVGDEVAPPYLDYGCLGSQPDPTWNTILFDEAGNYVFTLDQDTTNPADNDDVDFILWGPFNSQQEGCYNLLPETQVDCSFSASDIETITINGVQAGDIYVLLITNYGQSGGTFTFTQNSGPTDGTNCEVVCGADIIYNGSVLIEDPANPGYTYSIDSCGTDSIDLTATSPYADLYEWYFNGIYLSSGPNITVTESGEYQAVVSGDVCDGLGFSLTVLVNLGLEPTANAVPDLVACDDASGDGFESFDLESQTAGILGGQDPSLFNVTYHLTVGDAINNTGALNSPYINTANPQTIYVRVEDANSTTCIARTNFDLVVLGSDITATSADMEVCDDASGDGFEVFDLTSNDVNILGSQDPANFVVTYYLTEADANAGTDPLTSPYTNISNPQTIWARVGLTASVDCYAIVSFDLIVSPAPIAVGVDMEVCDDASGDGFEAFDLTTNDINILNGQDPMDYTVAYYATEADANAETSPLVSPYTNVTNPQTIWARVDSSGALDCYSVVSFDLIVSPPPTATTSNMELCDDASGDGFESFNLISNDVNVLNGQDPIDFAVSYYLNLNDAVTGTSPLTSPYTNISNSQTIWARVDNVNAVGCYAVVSLDLIVNPTPSATSVDMTVCDDVSGDGFEPFNLTSNDANILGGQNPSDFTVTYYAAEADADAGTSPLTSPYTNTSNPQTIWARVDTNSATPCYSTVSFDLNVSLPLANTSPDLAGCDTDDNGTPEYDLTTNEGTIIGGSVGTVTVTYYTTMADATNGTFPIGVPTNYETNLTTIYVRVQEGPCFNVTSFDLVAGELPMSSFATDIEFEVCPEATTPIILTVVPQNYTAADVSIVWLQDGGVINGQSGLTLPVLTQGFYEILVTFNETGCFERIGQQVTELELCEFPEGISPGVSPGLNDTFDLSNFRVTRIEIFNRLGTLVYSKDNYTDEWHGQSNSGDELPVGTYFYTVIYEGGAKTKSAWVYLNK
ncbi:MAG: gliding motility-associated C-terminal domain-containing protein [Aquaticitalea sp.]